MPEFVDHLKTSSLATSKVAQAPGERVEQPYLCDLVLCLQAPVLALSPADGQVHGAGASGFYVGDRRVVSQAVVTVDGIEPQMVQGQSVGADSAMFRGVLRHLGDPGADPTVFLQRTRRCSVIEVTEVVRVSSFARDAVRATMTLELGSDGLFMSAVKAGAIGRQADAGTSDVAGCRWTAPDGAARMVAFEPVADRQSGSLRWEWDLELAQGEHASVTMKAWVADDPVPPVVAAAPAGRIGAGLSVTSGDSRFSALINQSVIDLDGLVLADPLKPADLFLAAGAPWYLTLFGRDSLWAARMLLPLGTELAAGTLRTLARRQGQRVDVATAEAPGKILHEIRKTETAHAAGVPGGRFSLPPLYYGTVDATPLWINLLHDAWRWGLAQEQVADLLPALQAALNWLATEGMGRLGFLSYENPLGEGQGLTNQGWKDSQDSIQFQDGRLAQGPIALCEVQGYAYQAACQGADLLDAFGLPGATAWRDWAAELAQRFRASFWVDDPAGRYPAIALDGQGRTVDTVTSNMGHLLATGILNAAEAELVARRLASPELDCGNGLRTMSQRAAGFNPLAYHGGSVWTHDTAIAVHGLAATPDPVAGAAAGSLIEGLLRTATAFDFRLPELHSGDRAEPGVAPTPYPASCRPQAWSAAAAVLVLQSVLGLRPDVPAGVISLRTLPNWAMGPTTIRGLRVATGRLDLSVSAAGEITVLAAPPGLRIVNQAS